MLGKLLDNRTRLLYVLVSLIGAVAILGAGMMVMAKVGGGQIFSESEAATREATSAVSGEGVSVDASEARAAELFACKVDDMHDSAAVAMLLTAMGIEDVTGKYTVNIAEKDEAQVLTLTTEMPVKDSEEAAFNTNMEIYAQQMLALIPQLDRVVWIYSVDITEGGEEQAEGSMNDASVEEALGKTPEDYGKSEKAFGKLLSKQVQ